MRVGYLGWVGVGGSLFWMDRGGWAIILGGLGWVGHYFGWGGLSGGGCTV